ncbi:MAG TPA: DUF5666 domain-containing protein [Candidatus Paceibacterota bacterium]|nr:DUF5666 domain-containing protein [Candidatus Paceibacterota bacterium]
MKKYKTHIIWAIIAIIALCGGYFWGRSSATAARGAGFAGAFNASSTRTFARGGAAAGGGTALTVGQVTAMDSSSITLQLANGNSEVVFYSTSTAISEPTTVPASALKVGTTVMVTGAANSDGSVTAQNIQVRPAAAGPGGNAPVQQ